MRNGRFYVIWAVILILGVVGISVFASNTSSKTAEKSELAALQVNHKFVEKFFNYSSTGERYEGIKPYMTEQGYRALFPSGIEMPKDSAIKSLTTNLKAFIKKDPKTDDGLIEILNDFIVSTEYGGIQSSKNVIMRTQLVKEGNTWKINDIEMIIQNMEH